MKLFLIAVFLITSTISFSQESFSEADAKQVIVTFFEGFHQGDTLKMSSVLQKDAPMQTAFTDKDGNNVVSNSTTSNLLQAIAKRAKDQKWDERISQYNVQIDGNLAHVWTPYQFWFNDQLSHCGANAFTLAKTNTGWKIIHLIDSRRQQDCQ